MCYRDKKQANCTYAICHNKAYSTEALDLQSAMCFTLGKCECSSSYFGSDCSGDIKVAPVIKTIENAGICDLTGKKDCTCFDFTTEKLYGTFYCRIMTEQVRCNIPFI